MLSSAHNKISFGVIIVCIIMSVSIMGCIENIFLYFPAKYPQGFWDVGSLDFPIEDCFFSAEDGIELHGWFVPKKGAQATILWFHGNAGNISNRLEQVNMMRQLLGANIFIFDYRGYGRSQGKPSEKGLYMDAKAAYKYLLSRQDVIQDTIYLYGQSLGAAVAVYLAHEGLGSGAILEAGFSSLLDAAADIYPWLPTRFITKERYNSVKRIPKLKQPVLIIHGTEDDIINLKHSKKLYQAASEPKELLVLQGAEHNNLYLVGGETYWNKIKEFIK